MFNFYNNLFKSYKRSSKYDIVQFFELDSIPHLTEELSAKCEISISKNKSLRNDGLTKEFYKTFWDELKIKFIASFRKSFLKEEFNNHQKQVLIRLIEKKDKDKRLIQNWRPIRSFLNTDVKILSKVLAQRLKKILPFLISANQSANVDGRFISEGGKLISDLMEINYTLKLDGLLATIDIHKTFDSEVHF